MEMKLKNKDGREISSPSEEKVILLEKFKEKKEQMNSTLPYDFQLNYNGGKTYSKGSVNMEQNKFVTQQELENLSQRINHGQEIIDKDLSQFKEQILDIKNDSKRQHESLMKNIDDKFENIKDLQKSQFENIKDLQKSQFDTQSAEVKNYISSTIFKATSIGTAVATLIITIAIFLLDKFVFNS